MKLSEIWRYPIKSLSGAPLARVVLNPGLGLPHDRRWALARPQGKAIEDPAWHPKSQFFVLVRETALAELKCEFDERSAKFSLKGPQGLKATGNLGHAEGRSIISDAIAEHLNLAPEQAPVLVEAQKFGYFDATQGPLSLLNLASLRALESALGHSLAPERFRMNFFIEGGQAWSERTWIGKRVRIGKTVLRITEEIGRCKATHIDVDSGQEDVNVLKALKTNFGHTNMGVYAKVIEGGLIQPSDDIEVLG